MAKDIPYCPLMSAGSDIEQSCTLEKLRLVCSQRKKMFNVYVSIQRIIGN